MAVIGIDYDDVLTDFVPAWIEAINKMYGTTVDWESIDQWDLTPWFTNLAFDELCKPLESDKFWMKVKPKDGALEGVQSLINAGHKVYIVTASHPKSVTRKYTYLKDHFPWMKAEMLVVIQDKHLLNLDVLIDDYEENLRGVGIKNKLLFDAPHNKNVDETSLGAIRVRDWKEIADITHFDWRIT